MQIKFHPLIYDTLNFNLKGKKINKYFLFRKIKKKR